MNDGEIGRVHSQGPLLFVLLNHVMTEAQKEDAALSLGVTEIIHPPPAIKSLWSQVPSGAPAILDLIAPVREWLASSAREGDVVLIQGDFGACYLMVRFCMERGYMPVYSTTAREASEELLEDGSIRTGHVFKHERFRVYGR